MKGYQFYKDHADEWRWRLRDGNDQIVADSAEGYEHKSDCEKGAALFTTLGPDAEEKKIQEGDGEGSGNGPEWKYFKDKASQWRWHFQARNNKIIAASPKGYDGEDAVKAAIKHVKALLREIAKGASGQGYTPPATAGTVSGGRFA